MGELYGWSAVYSFPKYTTYSYDSETPVWMMYYSVTISFSQ